MAITDDEIRAMVTESRKGRQNAHKRALRQDAGAALDGNKTCREAMEQRRDARVLTLTISPGLAESVERYMSTDWKDDRDPSRIGALNAVAYLGEQLVRVYVHANPRFDTMAPYLVKKRALSAPGELDALRDRVTRALSHTDSKLCADLHAAIAMLKELI